MDPIGPKHEGKMSSIDVPNVKRSPRRYVPDVKRIPRIDVPDVHYLGAGTVEWGVQSCW